MATCLAVACAHGVRKEATVPIASDAPRAAAMAAAVQDPSAGPALSEREQIEHALSRTTFGARPRDRDRTARMGIAAFLEEQLHPERIDDAALDAQLAS